MGGGKGQYSPPTMIQFTEGRENQATVKMILNMGRFFDQVFIQACISELHQMFSCLKMLHHCYASLASPATGPLTVCSGTRISGIWDTGESAMLP